MSICFLHPWSLAGAYMHLTPPYFISPLPFDLIPVNILAHEYPQSYPKLSPPKQAAGHYYNPSTFFTFIELYSKSEKSKKSQLCKKKKRMKGNELRNVKWNEVHRREGLGTQWVVFSVLHSITFFLSFFFFSHLTLLYPVSISSFFFLFFFPLVSLSYLSITVKQTNYKGQIVQDKPDIGNLILELYPWLLGYIATWHFFKWQLHIICTAFKSITFPVITWMQGGTNCYWLHIFLGVVYHIFMSESAWFTKI